MKRTANPRAWWLVLPVVAMVVLSAVKFARLVLILLE